MSPYAAGCAVCGADLDVGRWDSGPGFGRRAVSWLNALSFGGLPPAAKWLLIGFLVVFFFGGPVLAWLAV